MAVVIRFAFLVNITDRRATPDAVMIATPAGGYRHGRLLP
jgi:hypothetical protein